MSDIPPGLLAEVLADVERELGEPESYSVPIDELFWRLIAKGYRPDPEFLADMERRRN